MLQGIILLSLRSVTCGESRYTVPILSCGGDKQSFTVVLAVKANGDKLPPKVIFKGVRQLRIEVPRRMQVSVHKKPGWMKKVCSFSFIIFIFIIFGVFNSGHNNFSNDL